MSRITNDIITSLRKSLQASDRKTSAYDTQATIRRIEGNTAWVHIPGGVDETPVQMTINASEGDTVQVRVSGGRAFLVGNATAPPTDDSYAKRMSRSLSGDLRNTNKVLRGLGRVVETVKDIASNTNQYFWHTEEGTDTGAHITEIPQEEFLADPENGGGNLLARSNGVAVRDGLDELSVFSAEGARIGKADEGHMAITDHEIKGMNARGMHFDVVGPLYAEETSGEAFSWRLKRGGSYTNYPSYPSGTNVLLVKFGVVEESATITLDLKYYYGSATEQTYNTSFTGGMTETKTNGSLFSVTYDASTDEIYLTSLSASVHHSGGSAYANSVHAQINKLQFVFGKQSDEYAGGDCSASIGMSCEARGSNSFATGDRTSASGDSAFASGQNTSASGDASFAEGASTVATGDYSHSEGSETEASGLYSHASGHGTVADGDSQTAVGKYNTRNSGALFSVGNGTSDSNRSDAFTVDEYGNGAFAGQVQVEDVLYAKDISVTVERISLSDLISVSSANATLIEGGGVRFGKTVQIYIKWKTVNAITVPVGGNITNVLVGTILFDYLKPIILTAAVSNGDLSGGAAWYTIHPTGEIYLGAVWTSGAQRTVAAGTEFSLMATYIAN